MKAWREGYGVVESYWSFMKPLDPIMSGLRSGVWFIFHCIFGSAKVLGSIGPFIYSSVDHLEVRYRLIQM